MNVHSIHEGQMQINNKTLTSLHNTSSQGECCCWGASCLAHYQSLDHWPDLPVEPSCPWARDSGCSAVCSCLCSRSWWRRHGADDSASGSGRAAEGASAAESGSERLPLGEREGKKNITRHIRDNLRISAEMLKFFFFFFLRYCWESFGPVRNRSRDDEIHRLPTRVWNLLPADEDVQRCKLVHKLKSLA